MDLAPCISGMQGKVSCTMFCSDPLLPNEHQESIWGHVQTASLFAIGSGQAETTNPLRVSQSQHHLSMAVLYDGHSDALVPTPTLKPVCEAAGGGGGAWRALSGCSWLPGGRDQL
eukprot:CAMPEP_0174377838 /NCGR_PEP_ID=MMETSP0811_2-20130205/121683_1 /TAXON_ID=73025 ORGANISM="Eutreptiella gymnastica-like, Strain CCMP1594" /NCGR_SAMPLE_ID=MMETSP0811_2 /ASSEMBLY_ACC=CAM_ASM_000667 /LENGTH=114 /DNA_ID=CAMNT_0015529923 /DNA_START=109 /DNA_END=454 /DNA_ORIENTATION=+